VRLTRIKALSIGSAIGLATMAISSCGGGDTVSADAYVGDICTAMGDYITTISEGQTEALSALSGGADPEEGKEQVTTFLDDATSASEEAASQIEDAGTPDVEDGEEIADAINAAFEGITTTFEDAQGAAEDLPTDSEESFQSAAQEISTDLTESSTQISEGLGEVQANQELTDAAENNSECQSLQTAGGITPPTGTTGTETP
jgi:hypothetical protein